MPWWPALDNGDLNTFRAGRPRILKLSQALATQVQSIPFIRRHSRNALARIPCRNALACIPCRNAFAHNLDRNVFARSRDPHHVGAHCRFVQKPRGTDR